MFFGLSAIGAYVLPSGAVVEAAWANGGTFLGALCFLIGAVLTMGETGSGESAPSDSGHAQGRS